MNSEQLTRRSLLIAAGSASVAAAIPLTAGAAPRRHRFEKFEADYGVTIGVYARNLRTGRDVAHRADSRFPIASVFKMVAAGGVLRGDLVTPDRDVLSRPVHLPPIALVEYSPFVEDCLERGIVPTVEEMCVAALQLSDNTAGNSLLSLIGGPAGLTQVARHLKDTTTRLDRWEPELNSAEPDRVTDTTTPRAIGRTLARMLVGDGLPRQGRRKLTTWMLGNTTSDHRLRAALPTGWRLADKTGSAELGCANNVGVAWSPDGTPVLLSVMVRPDDPAAERDEKVFVDVGRACLAAVGF